MDLIRSLLGRRGAVEPVEPRLSPKILEQYRNLSAAERRRLVRKAEQEAAASLSVHPRRDFAAERDAWVESELSGIHRQMAAAVQAEFRNLGDRKLHWAIIVGQDDPPDGLWGWVTIEAHKWPAAVISRGPLAFATHDEAMVAGETAADAL